MNLDEDLDIGQNSESDQSNRMSSRIKRPL